MITTTVIYFFLMAFVGIRHYKITKAKLDFGGAEFARYAALESNKGMGKFFTLIYIIVMLFLYF